jgi:hypothetical protein
MKKMFRFLVTVLCCALTATVFTSCGKDDDDDNFSDTSKIVAYEVSYSYELPAQAVSEKYGNLLDLCQKVEIGYVDENGKEQWENFDLNTKKWAKTIKYTSSFSSFIKLHFIKKENVEYLFDAYRFNGADATVAPNSMLKGVLVIDSNGKRTEAAVSGWRFNDHSKSTSFVKTKEGTNGRSKLDDFFNTEASYVSVINFGITF